MKEKKVKKPYGKEKQVLAKVSFFYQKLVRLHKKRERERELYNGYAEKGYRSGSECSGSGFETGFFPKGWIRLV